MTAQKSVIICIDLCDTFVEGNTTFLFLNDYFSNNKKYIFLSRIKKNILIRLIFKLLFILKIDLNRASSNIFLKGITRKDLLFYADFMANNKFQYNPKIIELIKCAQKNSIPIYIVSASLDFIVEAVAKKHNLLFSSTTLHYDNDICSGKIEKDLLFQKNKSVEHILNQYPQHKLIFISDNIQDLEIIKSTPYGFGVYNRKNTCLFQKNKIKDFKDINDFNLLFS